MSLAADHERSLRRVWALPGSSHDRFVRLLRIVLPVLAGVLALTLAVWPLMRGRDISFVLAKDRVAIARERLRVTSALYRGQDSRGQPFAITAGSAVQTSSREPIVRLSDLAAEIRLADGPARVVANAGRYDMDQEKIAVDGPVRFTAAGGYRLDTRDVLIDIATRSAVSRGPVSGSMSLGNFSAGRIATDITQRTVTLDQGVRLHIVQARGTGAP